MCKYYQQNTITRLANETTLCLCESTLRDSHARINIAQGVWSTIVQK